MEERKIDLISIHTPIYRILLMISSPNHCTVYKNKVLVMFDGGVKSVIGSNCLKTGKDLLERFQSSRFCFRLIRFDESVATVTFPT